VRKCDTTCTLAVCLLALGHIEKRRYLDNKPHRETCYAILHNVTWRNGGRLVSQWRIVNSWS